jgi:hypothetical protein
MGFTSSPEAAMADHRLYAGLAAQAAGVAGVAFVDLQPVLSFPEGAPNTDLFSPDRIHPTPEVRSGDAPMTGSHNAIEDPGQGMVS